MSNNDSTKKKWKRKITSVCKKAGTYRPTFDLVIMELAEIISMRESATEYFISNGNKTIIEYTNKSGNTNIVKNPAISIIIQLDQLALSYWRELGLTPKGYKALGADAIEQPKGNRFEDLIAEIEADLENSYEDDSEDYQH